MRTIKPPPLRYPHRLSVRILLTFGTATILCALFAAEPDVAFFARADRVEGKFVGAIVQKGGSHGGAFYHPMFSYKANDGSIRTFTVKSGSTGQPYADGAKVPVYVDPEHPEVARTNGLLDVWLMPIVLGVAGGLLLGIGLVLRRTFRSRAAGAPISR
jgi:hypothetical protein